MKMVKLMSGTLEGSFASNGAVLGLKLLSGDIGAVIVL